MWLQRIFSFFTYFTYTVYPFYYNMIIDYRMRMPRCFCYFVINCEEKKSEKVIPLNFNPFYRII